MPICAIVGAASADDGGPHIGRLYAGGRSSFFFLDLVDLEVAEDAGGVDLQKGHARGKG